MWKTDNIIHIIETRNWRSNRSLEHLMSSPSLAFFLGVFSCHIACNLSVRDELSRWIRLVCVSSRLCCGCPPGVATYTSRWILKTCNIEIVSAPGFMLWWFIAKAAEVYLKGLTEEVGLIHSVTVSSSKTSPRWWTPQECSTAQFNNTQILSFLLSFFFLSWSYFLNFSMNNYKVVSSINSQ